MVYSRCRTKRRVFVPNEEDLPSGEEEEEEEEEPCQAKQQHCRLIRVWPQLKKPSAHSKSWREKEASKEEELLWTFFTQFVHEMCLLQFSSVESRRRASECAFFSSTMMRSLLYSTRFNSLCVWCDCVLRV